MLKKKLIKISSIILCSLIMITLTIATVNATATNVKYLTTCVGDVPTTININYHIDKTGSTVELCKTKYFTNFTTYTPTESEFEHICTDSGYGWEKRIVCKLTITDLEENTTYYYRVNTNRLYSEIMEFTTGTLKSTKQSILWVTDIHATTGWDNTATVNSEIKNIIEKNNYDVNLMITTGDQIDRAGRESDEEIYYNGIPYIRQFIHAAIPGNHELYTTASGTYYEPNVFNALYNNPQNGPSTNLNSSYYFKTGDVLVIMIDCIKQNNYSEQSAWAKKVIQENPSKWIIMGTHCGYVTCGSYASDSKYMVNYYKRIAEECQVDLCISGHEHIYIRKVSSYKNQYDEELGVTYITSLSSGPKQYSIQAGYTDYDYAIANQPFSSNIITIDGDEMTVKLYDKNGNLFENGTVTLKAKRNTSANLTDEEIINSLSYEYADGFVTAKVNGDIYSQVSAVSYKVIIDGKEASDNAITLYSKYTNEKMFAVNQNKDNHIEVTFTKRDGTTLTTSFDINNYKEPEYTITYELNGGEFTEENVLSTYKKGQTDAFPIPTKEGYTFKGWYTSKEFMDGTLREAIKETDSYNIKLYANWEEAIEPDPVVDEPTSSCKSQAVMLFITIMASISIAYVIIRKH